MPTITITIRANAGRYTVNGLANGFNPPITLQRGSISDLNSYLFDFANASYPFLITPTSGAFNATTTVVYNANLIGINEINPAQTISGRGGGTMTFNISYDTPNILYYNSTTNGNKNTITISPALTTTTLSNFTITNKSLSLGSFQLTNPSSNRTGNFTFQSLNPTLATVSGNTVTMLNTGTVTIRAIQPSDNTTYFSGLIDTSFTIEQSLSPTITNFTIANRSFSLTPFTISDPSSNSLGAFSYISLDTSTATITNKTITMLKAGSVTIRATQAANGGYASQTADATFTINAISPTITNFTIANRSFSLTPFTITDPSSNSLGAFSYTSLDTTTATITSKTITMLKAGTVTIRATQAANGGYTSQTADATFTINTISPTITNFTIANRSFSLTPFTITDPSSNSLGAFSYISLDTTTATITSKTITMLKAGSVTIRATQEANGGYTSQTADATFTINAISPTITNFTITNRSFSLTPFTITDPSSNSLGAFSYISLDTTTASISSKTITMLKAGSVTIRATQAENGGYASQTADATFTINALIPTITNFSIPDQTYTVNGKFAISDPTSGSSGAFVYDSLNKSIATVTGKTGTMLQRGPVTFSVSQEATDYYTAGGTAYTSFKIQSTPTITNFSIPNQNYVVNGKFAIPEPISDSSGAFVYNSLNNSIATVSGKTGTMLQRGPVTFSVSQEATDYYTAGGTAYTLFDIQSTPTITNFSIPNQTYAVNGKFAIPEPISDSSGVFVYDSSNKSIATVTGKTGTMLQRGPVTFSVSQEATDYYTAGGTAYTSFKIQSTPIITNFSIPNQTYTVNGKFAIPEPISDSSGAFVYNSLNNSIATVSGKTGTMLERGSVTFSVSQEESDYYTAGGTAYTSFNIQSPTTLSNFTITNKVLSLGTFTLTDPSSNRLGSFTYISSDTAKATVSGNTVTLRQTGSVTITATQLENNSFTASTITANFNIQDPTILSNFTITNKLLSLGTFILTDPVSNRLGSFTYTSSDTSKATVSGNTVTLKQTGSVTITVIQLENEFYTTGTITANFKIQDFTTLTNFTITNKLLSLGSFTLTDPSSNHLGSFTYTSSDTTKATVSGNTVTLRQLGPVTITATQLENDFYTTGTITANFNIQDPTTLSNFTITNKLLSIGSFIIIDPLTNRAGSFTYTSSDTTKATVSSNTVTLRQTGPVTITATQLENDFYTTGTITTNFNIQDPTILSNFTITNKLLSLGTFTLTDPSSNRLGSFSYTSSDTTKATVSGNTVTLRQTGPVTITATQIENDFYTTGTITKKFNIQDPTILSNFTITTKLLSLGSFIIPDPSSNRTGDFTYTSSDTTKATVSGNTVTLRQTGPVTITATQLENEFYATGTITTNFNIKTPPTITNFTIPDIDYSPSGTFEIIDPSSNSSGTFSYTSLDTSKITISGKNVTILEAGNVTITLTQQTDDNYTTLSINKLFTINKILPTIINFTDINIHYSPRGTFLLTDPSSNSTGAFSYSSLNKFKATVSEKTVTILQAGTGAITAIQETDVNYLSHSVTVTLEINKILPTISNFTIPSRNYSYGDTVLITDPSSNSTGSFTYTSLNTNKATVSGKTITMLEAGTVEFTAIQQPDINYTISNAISTMFVIHQISPTITNFTIPNQQYSPNGIVTITDPSSNSNGIFSYSSSNTTKADISGNTIHILEAGTVTITATQQPSVNYLSNSISTLLTIDPISPTITNFIIPSVNYYPRRNVVIQDPSSNSTGAFSYTSLDKTKADISGNTIIILEAGTVTIVVKQEATVNYTSGSESTTLVINQISPTIHDFIIPTQNYSPSGTFTLTDPSSNSTGAFSYTSLDTNKASVSGRTVTIFESGTVTITATQQPDVNYLSNSISASLVIEQINPTFGNFIIPNKNYSPNGTFNIQDPPSNNSENFSYISDNINIAFITGRTVTILEAGTVNITATQKSGVNYKSRSITTPLTINPISPTITQFTVSKDKYSIGDIITLTQPVSNSSGTFSYSSSDETIASVTDTTVTMLQTGSVTITATQSPTTNYTSGSISVSFTVGNAIIKKTNMLYSLFTNNAQVYYNIFLSGGGVGTVSNSRIKSRKT